MTSTIDITSELVEEAYKWGLGVVAMYRYYGIMGEKFGGINKLGHNRKPTDPGQFTGGPNRDGLYSFGWFHLDDEPIVVSLDPMISCAWSYRQLTSLDDVLGGKAVTKKTVYGIMPDGQSGRVTRNLMLMRS